MWNKIQRIYVGSNQVRPIKKIECDFTQSDCWFTFVGRTSTALSYGRNSNWLYTSASSWQLYGAAWAIPSSVYSEWTPIKIELQLYATQDQCGGGVSVWVDTSVVRAWRNVIESYFWTLASVTLANNTPWNTVYIYTIDLKNGEAYISTESWTKLTLPSEVISGILSNWSSWTLNICNMLYRSSGTKYSYIQKATFEIYG